MGFSVAGVLLLLGIVACCLDNAVAAKLPKNFLKCHQSDPNFDDCMKVAIEDAIRKLKDGSSELGMKPLDPLLINELVIGQGTGPVNVQQNFHNCKLHGLTGSIVLAHKANLKENGFFAQSITPELRLDCEYDMNGRVLLLPIYGKGRSNVTLFNTHINHTLKGSASERKGKTYMKIDDFHVTLRPEKMTYSFENLFNGDDRLGGEIVKVLNENWEEVFTDVRDGYEKSFGIIFKDLANRVFTRVPFSEIYPD